MAVNALSCSRGIIPTKNLRLYVDGAHRILGHEGRSPENRVKTALYLEEKGKFS